MTKKTYDLSPNAIRKQVVKNTLQHPAVLYPGAVGLLGGVAAVLLGPTTIPLLLAAGGASLAGLSWGLNFGLRGEKFANSYVKNIYNQMESQRIEQTQDLLQRLKEFQSEKGIEQYHRLEKKFETFKLLIQQKFSPHELTFGRYLGIAEQVYLACIDNLEMLASTLKSVRAIDENFIRKRLAEIEHDSVNSREKDALIKRFELKQKQQERIRQIIASNEEAMTQLDMTSAAIAEMKTQEGRSSMGMEFAMKELSHLAARTHVYSIDSSE